MHLIPTDITAGVSGRTYGWTSLSMQSMWTEACWSADWDPLAVINSRGSWEWYTKSSGINILQTKSWALAVSAIHAISADALRCWDGMCPGRAFRSERMQWRQPISLSHAKLHLQGFPCNSRKTADCNICAASTASLSRDSIVSLRLRSSFAMQTGLWVLCLAWHGFKLQSCSMGTSKISTLPPHEKVRLGWV